VAVGPAERAIAVGLRSEEALFFDVGHGRVADRDVEKRRPPVPAQPDDRAGECEEQNDAEDAQQTTLRERVRHGDELQRFLPEDGFSFLA
jgi:hypothetical protein